MRAENKTMDGIICVLLTFMIMSFYIFETASWGKYVVFVISVLIMLLYAWQNNFRIPLVFTKSFHVHVAAFAFFCMASSVWAWNSSLAMSKGTTIFLILVSLSLVYPWFHHKGSIDILLDAIMLSGYGVAIYAIAYYGPSGILLMLDGNIRVENDLLNANALGLVVVTSCIIQFSYLLKKKKQIFSIFMLPCLVILAFSQSRKALIMLSAGVAFLIMTNGNVRSSFFRTFFSFIVGVATAILLLQILLQLEMFSGVFERFETLFESIEGTRGEDVRAIYRRIGMQQFSKTPVLGIGIGNSLELLASVGERRTYLHCNFVELLACGGIVGFFIYYFIYARLLYGLWKNRACRSEVTNLCIVLMVLMLIMDYGMVTYYDKQQYLYFMCFFLQLDFVKKDHDNEARRKLKRGPKKCMI